MLERFKQLPRSMQWATLAAVGMIAFLAYDSAIRPMTTAWSLQADEIEGTVRQVREAQEIRDALGKRSSPAFAFGVVERPEGDDEGRADLIRAVNDIMKNYQVSNDDFSMRPRGRMKQGTLSSIARGRRIERISGEIKFDATPEDAIAIIANLESHPAIEAVTEVRMMSPVNRKVSVRLTVESWVLSASRT